MGKRISINPGDRFGRITIVSEAERHINPNGKTNRKFHCVCDCGSEKTIFLFSLTQGHTKSCGCLQKEILKDSLITHGMARTAEYKTWIHIKSRCLNPHNTRFHDYGGRGIKICDRWLSFDSFYEDMGNIPSHKHSIERVDNDGDYKPENCRWATNEEQANNRRTSRLIEFNGRTLSISQWAIHIGVHRATIQSRIDRGWSIENILSKTQNTSPQLPPVPQSPQSPMTGVETVRVTDNLGIGSVAS